MTAMAQNIKRIVKLSSLKEKANSEAGAALSTIIISGVFTYL